MKNYLIIFIAIIGLTGFKAGSQRTISGTVYNAVDKKTIQGVHVLVAGTGVNAYTNAQGRYSITMSGNKARLVFSAAGYQTDTITINNSAKLDIYLKRQMVYKMDTVAYKASPYDVNHKPTVGELLKKMEGMQVNADGSVVSQGKAVTKTRVNGKDFVGGNVRAAVKNLPADILQEVQVIDSYSDQASVLHPAPSVFLNSRSINSTESYGRIVENQFIDPKSTPLSTFAVDVDAASYANVRRFINNGQLPPKNAVRIEEMINYFHYDLPEPTNSEPVAIKTELSTAPWNPQHQLVRIGLKAKNVKTDKLPPSNLVFLIDVSGSMNEANKLPLVKTSMKMLVDQLRPNDHVAIVVYASEVGIKLASTPGDQKVKIKDVIDQLGAGGGTAGGAGISMAYQIARQNFIKGGNNRIILATDGDFNVGPSSNKDMEQLIEEERGSGVSISILGFGMGNLKDSKMERMADKGHGNYAYIDNITEATKSMVTEFGGTLFTVAKDVKLQVEFNPANVQAYRLLGYEDRLMAKEDFNNDTKIAGDMGVGHTVTALYEIIPAGVKDSFTGSVDPLKYQKVTGDKPVNNSPEVMTVKFRYKQPDSEVSKMESVVVNNKPVEADKTSEDFRFAAAVAEYGMLLRNSQFKQTSRFDQLIKMAKSAKGKDEDGYRSEFIRLAESTMNMMKSTAQVVNEE
jgi:Ca-activated chloride channel family protein